MRRDELLVQLSQFNYLTLVDGASSRQGGESQAVGIRVNITHLMFTLVRVFGFAKPIRCL